MDWSHFCKEICTKNTTAYPESKRRGLVRKITKFRHFHITKFLDFEYKLSLLNKVLLNKCNLFER